MATDLTAQRECALRDIRITGLARWKANIWPENQSHFAALAGQKVNLVVTLGDRYPIRNARVVATSPLFKRVLHAVPVGWVQFPEDATQLPDPIFEIDSADLPANSTQSFLLALEIASETKPGKYSVAVRGESDSHAAIETTCEIEVLAGSGVLSEKVERGACCFWPQWDAFCRTYKLELWSEEFWAMAEKYLREMASAGMNVVMASICADPFRYPLPPEYYHHHHIPAMIEWRRDQSGAFHFDYTNYDRYVELNFRLGINREIECHSMLPCKAQRPTLEYFDEARGEVVSFETNYNAPEYLQSWQAFLQDFASHNCERGWLEKVTLCPYDEPENIESFKAVAALCKRIAPEIRITAAITAKRALQVADVIDVATVHPEVDYSRAAHDELLARGVEVRWYNCCEPRWGNTLFCCDLAEAYRVPWITAAHNFSGYLRWAFLNWTENPWRVPVFCWPTGDMYLLYPGESGPASSLRWEAYRAGCDDVSLALSQRDALDDERKKLLDEHIQTLGVLQPLGEPGDISAWRSRLATLLAEG